MIKIVLSILLVSSLSVNAQFWTEKATGFAAPARTLNSISIVDANVVWGNEFDNATDDYTLKGFTRTTDGGENWTTGSINLGLDTSGLGISSITAASDLVAWVSAYPETGDLGGIWKTINGGMNWTKQPTASFSGSDSYANFVYFWDVNNGIAVGDPEGGTFEIYTTNDGGTTWTRVSGVSLSAVVGVDWGYFDAYAVSGNTIWFGANQGRVFKSADKGLNWTVLSTPVGTNFGLDRFTFSTESKGLLMKYDPVALYSTTDGGANWNPVTFTGQIFNTDIAYIPGTSIVVSAARANPLGSSYSINDGVTWTSIDAVSHGTLAFLNDSFGFSAGLNTNSTTGGIFKFTGIPTLKTQTFDAGKQISAYPNPTNGILHLDSEFSPIKDTKLFDQLGRQVHDSKFQSSNKVNLDLNSLQNGLYLLKITTDSGKTETIKIMKN